MSHFFSDETTQDRYLSTSRLVPSRLVLPQSYSRPKPPRDIWTRRMPTPRGPFWGVLASGHTGRLPQDNSGSSIMAPGEKTAPAEVPSPI
ncbi:hypothetical protein RSOLAG1IB_11528 [Rhizoctonia solani AG-1 IB]|uniref:Uncharacterized protein n=1 Tax=Thanatephorus cucumeris (strain AG1-IB / isolate 7/3/14) TaxID=1108050 RepID=A0A0B7F7F3_THACB|nr:hypothetical protein RSOLAG1IB_11528 [Rhizoctonia solani AG-1 IB]